MKQPLYWFLAATLAAAGVHAAERIVEAEAAIGSDSKVIADPAASGGKAVTNGKVWQLLVSAPLPSEGARVTIAVRHKGGPLQLKSNRAGQTTERDWVWAKPSAWTWSTFGTYAVAELGDKIFIMRGENADAPQVDAVRFTFDGTAPAPATPADSKTASTIEAEQYASSDSRVYSDPKASGGKAVVNSRLWQPLVLFPTPKSGDMLQIRIRHRGGPIQLKVVANGQQVEKDWVWNRPQEWTWSTVGTYRRADLGEQLILMRGDAPGDVTVDAIAIEPVAAGAAADADAPAPAVAANNGPALPPDALVKSESKTLPPEHPDDTVAPEAVGLQIDWTKSIRDLPADAWGMNDYEILNPTAAANAGYNQFLTVVRPPWVRIHNGGVPKVWLDTSGKAWDVEKIKACFAGATGLADTKIMLNIAGWPDWMKDEQGLVRKDCYDAYAQLYVDLMRTMRDDVQRKVDLWEITNEADGNYEKHKRLDDLWQLYNTVAVAMRKFDPQAKLGGPAFTWAKREWVEGFAKNCLANADFVTYHNYGTGDMYDSNETLYGKLPSMESAARSMRSIVDQHAGGRHIPIYLDEYNVKWVWTPIERRHGNSVGSVFHAGVVRRIMLAGIDGASLWHLKGHSYGIIEGDNSIRPAAHLFLWAPRFLVGKMMETSTPDQLEVIAVLRPDGGRSLLIANKANHTITLGTLVSLGLPSPAELRQVHSRGNFDAAAPTTPISLPGYSVTLLTTTGR